MLRLSLMDPTGTQQCSTAWGWPWDPRFQLTGKEWREPITMKPLLGILNRSRRKEMIIAGRQELHLVGWRTVAISKVETVWRTVVAWRWSTVHLIRQIWQGEHSVRIVVS